MSELTTDVDERAPDDGPVSPQRARLLDGLATLRRERSARAFVGGRLLLFVAGGVVGLGLTLIVLGWVGASRTFLPYEQTSYLISGGLLGLALCVVGASAYFAHWIAVSVRDQRRMHQESLAAMERLGDRIETALGLRTDDE